MVEIISITSGKGGVGKTTITANLSAALSEIGKNVVAIDANFTTPNLGLFLGVYLPEVTIHDVLAGRGELKKSIYFHPLGFKIICGSLNVNDLENVNPEIFLNIPKSFENSDFVLIDTAAGLGREAIYGLKASEKVIIVTTPDIASLMDAYRVSKIAEDLGKEIIGIILNFVPKRREKIAIEKTKTFLNYPILGVLNEDKKVRIANNEKVPIIQKFPNSKFSKEMRKIAYKIAGYEFSKKDFVSKIVSWILR